MLDFIIWRYRKESIKDLTRRMEETEHELKENNQSLLNMLKELEGDSPEIKDALSEII